MPTPPIHLLASSTPRLGARLLLLDADDRLLLIHAHDPTEPQHEWWELPGGGLAEGEDSAAACRRELAEETGIIDVKIGPVVWERESLFRYLGRDHHRFDWVHLGRLASASRQARRWTANERTTVLGEQWWTLPELEVAHGERFLPQRLPALLGDILAGRQDGIARLYEDTR
jgi:8-oxo-dGTP pyrophosphatase MutT (NUDIX family)